MASRVSQYRRVEPALVEQRGMLRHQVSIARATVRRHGETAGTATLHDLSVYGCRVSSDTPYELGERLWLRLSSSMPIAGTVVWSDGEVVGCRFDAPIERTLVRSLTLLPA